MPVQPSPPSAAACDPVTPEARLGPVTPEPRASGPPSQAQPLLRQEATREEEGEETGGQGAWGTGTAEQRRRGWGEADEGTGKAGGTEAAGSGPSAAGTGDGQGSRRLLLGWLLRRPPQCCPCAAPLPRSAAHCCHGGTKMAALAYNLGKREINHYFSVRSAKVLALVAVLLLAACHLASRRYRGERALPLPWPAGGGGAAAPSAGGRPPPQHAHAPVASAAPRRPTCPDRPQRAWRWGPQLPRPPALQSTSCWSRALEPRPALAPVHEVGPKAPAAPPPGRWGRPLCAQGVCLLPCHFRAPRLDSGLGRPVSLCQKGHSG